MTIFLKVIYNVQIYLNYLDERQEKCFEVCTEAPKQCGLVCEENNNRKKFLEETKNSEKWSLDGRKKYLSNNKFNAELYEYMLSKNTNLCLAIDLDNVLDILDVS